MRYSLLSSEEPIPAPVGLWREMDMLDRVSSGETEHDYFIWRSQNAVVVPASIAREPLFGKASSTLEARGWPVVVRKTGGDIVPQSPGILNVALAFKTYGRSVSISDTYLSICNPVIKALQSYGISAVCSSIQGSFCDGDFNIVVSGKKLAGTAQRWRKAPSKLGVPSSSVLVQMAILCDPNLSELWKLGNEFYRLCELPKRIDPKVHLSLASLVQNRSSEDNFGLHDSFSQAIRAELDVSLSHSVPVRKPQFDRLDLTATDH